MTASAAAAGHAVAVVAAAKSRTPRWRAVSILPRPRRKPLRINRLPRNSNRKRKWSSATRTKADISRRTWTKNQPQLRNGNHVVVAPRSSDSAEAAEDAAAGQEPLDASTDTSKGDTVTDAPGRTAKVHAKPLPIKPRTGWWETMPQPVLPTETATDSASEEQSEVGTIEDQSQPEPAAEKQTEPTASSHKTDGLPVKPRRGWWEIGG